MADGDIGSFHNKYRPSSLGEMIGNERMNEYADYLNRAPLPAAGTAKGYTAPPGCWAAATLPYWRGSVGRKPVWSRLGGGWGMYCKYAIKLPIIFVYIKYN